MCSKWRGDEWRAWGGTRGSGRRCQQQQVDTVDTETEAAGVEILRSVTSSDCTLQPLQHCVTTLQILSKHCHRIIKVIAKLCQMCHTPS